MLSDYVLPKCHCLRILYIKNNDKAASSIYNPQSNVLEGGLFILIMRTAGQYMQAIGLSLRIGVGVAFHNFL